MKGMLSGAFVALVVVCVVMAAGWLCGLFVRAFYLGAGW